MRLWMCAALAGLSWAIALPSSGSQAAFAEPPVEAFGKRPMISDVTISPGGTHYAALQWLHGQGVIAIYNLYPTSASDRVKLISTDASRKIEEKVESVKWLNDETVSVVFEWESQRGQMRVPVRETRLVAINAKTSKARQIPRVLRSNSYQGQIQHRILDYLEEDDDHVLMALNREGDGLTLNVYRVNVRTGTVERVVKGGPDVAGYMTDQNSAVRLRWLIRGDRTKIQHREPDGKTWQNMMQDDRISGADYWPLGFTSKPNHLLVGHTGEDGFDQIDKYDVHSGAVIALVRKEIGRDVAGVTTNRHTGAITGYRVDDHRSRTVYIDKTLKAVQDVLDTRLPGMKNVITSYDRAKAKFTVLSSGPKNPGTYYLYQSSGKQLNKILDRNAIPLDTDELGTMSAIQYKARDGQDIPAYLTVPAGKEAPYPFIVMPHGGPTSRDHLSYNYWVQFLASRGYAVLQPQFRGSTGFGLAHQKAGYKQWGLLMQDDITDAARAMIEQGIADPGRMCIVGGSYGGYAALMGTVVTPDLFQCAVSFAGVTDIDRLIKEGMRYKFAIDNPPNVGSRKDDKQQLRDTSPINNIDVIKTPILLVHGDKDLSVEVDHSQRMAKALKRAGKPYKLVILKDGNHHLQLEKHRIRFLTELEAFLDSTIGK